VTAGPASRGAFTAMLFKHGEASFWGAAGMA